MKLKSKDLASVKIPALVLLACLVFAYFLVNFALGREQRAENQLVAQKSALREASERFQRSGDERETILRYLPAYQQLQAQGFVGDERRVNWIESLRAANSRAGLFGVNYQINPQEAFPYLPAGSPVANQVRSSEMKLTFGVMHEGDLMRFFRALEAERAGMFTLTACILDRATSVAEPAPRQANLRAECALSWITIHPLGGMK